MTTAGPTNPDSDRPTAPTGSTAEAAPDRSRAPVPLSVWPTGQQPSRVQRAGRYVPAAMAHPGKMLPAIAARAIAEYTAPGDLVLDPMCGIGTTLVEAVHLGRDAVGVEYEPHWVQLARRNLHHARSQGATGAGRVLQSDARHIDTLLGEELHGQVTLLLTSPPYGSSLHGQVTARPGHGVTKRDYRYSRDRANLAHLDLDQLTDGILDILTGCTPFLRPGGIVAMTVRPYWSQGSLVDLPARLSLAITERTELALLDRNVTLLAGIRDDHLITRASFFQLSQVRRARAAGLPRHLIAHEDLVAFQARHPSSAAAADTAAGVQTACSGQVAA